MKIYTVIQKPNYRILETTNKKEAEEKLKEMEQYCKDRYYICEQGFDDK